MTAPKAKPNKRTGRSRHRSIVDAPKTTPRLVLPGGRYTLFRFGIDAPPTVVGALAREVLEARRSTRPRGKVWIAEVGQLWMGPQGPVVRFSPAVPGEALEDFAAGVADIFEFRRVRAALTDVVLERSQAVAWFQDDFERVWSQSE